MPYWQGAGSKNGGRLEKAELAERVVEGMAIARYFDNLVKRIKNNNSIRKSINLK